VTGGAMERTWIQGTVPSATMEWLTGPDNPAVAVLAQRDLLGKQDDAGMRELWGRRNEYAPVARILDAMSEGGTWATPARDYQKYGGSLWQVHFLGELYADGDDPRVRKAAEYAFSRQLPDGSWSCNGRPDQSIACLTANVGRALARLGYADDVRVLAALEYCVRTYEELGTIDCRAGRTYTLNGYCHMLTAKELLFLGEVPRGSWPKGADALRGAAVEALREKRVVYSYPAEAREFQDQLWSMPSAERPGFRERFLEEHPELHYKEKAGWLRFGYPLSYNSDALEALLALIGVGESPRDEYAEAIEIVRGAADKQMRWKLRNSFNGKMLADVEVKGEPSKWLTYRALRVLEWADTAR